MFLMKVTGQKTTHAPTAVPVVRTIQADLLTPLAVYLRISEGFESSFLLESVEGGSGVARYSFIGADPVMVVKGGRDRVEITKSEASRTAAIGTIEFLRSYFEERRADADAALPPFIGGAIGCFEFECSDWFSAKATEQAERPN